MEECKLRLYASPNCVLVPASGEVGSDTLVVGSRRGLLIYRYAREREDRRRLVFRNGSAVATSICAVAALPGAPLFLAADENAMVYGYTFNAGGWGVPASVLWR